MGWGVSGCEQRIEVFMKIRKKIGGGGRVGGGQGARERGIEVFVNIQKKSGGGRSGWGVRVDVNEELKFL